jgi:hypothetical protein
MAEIDVGLTLDETPEARAEPISEDGGASPLHGEITRAVATTVGDMRCIGGHLGFPALRSRTLHEGVAGRITPQFRRLNRSLTRPGKSAFALCHPRPAFCRTSRKERGEECRRSGGRSSIWTRAARLYRAVRTACTAGRSRLLVRPTGPHGAASALRPPLSCVIASPPRIRSIHRRASRGDNGCVCA